MSNGLFLPYQRDWINDRSRFKIIEKSRRTGMTFAQSWEDVEDCLKKRVPAVWFSSSDESAAKEYMEYCQNWAKVLNMAAEPLGQEIIEKETVTTLKFKNGTKIVALSSNPKAFRSKGGKVVLDEFAFHDKANELYKAAKPSITSMKGLFPLRVISTHNGKNCRYFEFLDQAKKGKIPWSVHYVDIYKAVDQGYLDKIYGRTTTREEKDQWLAEEKAATGDDLVWQQEYCCIPVDESTAFLTYDLIKACEDDSILYFTFPESAYFMGIDIGREKDLTVVWIVEKTATQKITRYVLELKKTAYSEQLDIISDLIDETKARRVCVDASGIGDMPAETLQERHGRYKVEKVKFTNPIKEELAVNVKIHFEDRLVLIPQSEEIRRDLHSIRKLSTSAGNSRYDAGRSNGSHADRFWALALALHACDNDQAPLIECIFSANPRKMMRALDGF
ncbi:MAG: hypothetical protein HY817_01500 [Candidatus Abawacabacteria bacterium]|nr:hypothetical protein [Candidatus Abawacabacteria bacterium]